MNNFFFESNRTSKRTDLTIDIIEYQNRYNNYYYGSQTPEFRLQQKYNNIAFRMSRNRSEQENFNFDGNLFIFSNVFLVKICKYNPLTNKLEDLLKINFKDKTMSSADPTKPKEKVDLFADSTSKDNNSDNFEFVLFARIVDNYETLAANNDSIKHTKNLVIVSSYLNVYSYDITNLDQNYVFSSSDAANPSNSQKIDIKIRDFTVFEDIAKIIPVKKVENLTEDQRQKIHDFVDDEMQDRNRFGWGFQDTSSYRPPEVSLAGSLFSFFF